MDLRRKPLVDFNAEKTQLVSFDQFNNTGAINVCENGWVCYEGKIISWNAGVDFLF